MYINRIGNVKVGGGLPDLLYSQTDQCARTAKKMEFSESFKLSYFKTV